MVSKTGSSNIYNSHTCLEVVTTGFPKFYKPPTSLHAWWRLKRNIRISTSLLHAWQYSKRTLQTSTCLLHAWRRSKRTPRTSTSLLHAWQWSKQTRRTSLTYFTVDKTDFPYFCYHPKCLRWSERTVRTSTSLLLACRRSKQTLRTTTSLTTRLAGVKTDSPYFYKPPTR